MTVLNFPAPVPDQPASFTQILLSLSDPGAQARIAACTTADLLREAYAEHWMGGQAQATPSVSFVSFTAALGGLTDDRQDYWLQLAHYAVQVEMKHWADESYALHADAAHEVLVDLCDYLPDDDDQAEASRDNRDRWAELAETATHYALAETAVIVLAHAA